jgi:hypothetical protein
VKSSIYIRIFGLTLSQIHSLVHETHLDIFHCGFLFRLNFFIENELSLLQRSALQPVGKSGMNELEYVAVVVLICVQIITTAGDNALNLYKHKQLPGNCGDHV